MLLTRLFADEIRSLRRGDATTFEPVRAIRLADKAARSAAPVLIEGEPGTGGEALARAIHICGERRAKPFVSAGAGRGAQEVGAALFGFEAGTGRHPGRFVEAQGGTVLIQNVEDLPPDVQGAVLRAIQDGEIQPVGARRTSRVDARVVATTQVDLAERVRQGRFREDLFYRLHVLPIGFQPLRRRKNELAGLAAALIQLIAADEGKPVCGLSPDALALIRAYDWPGNLRQLENVLFRAVSLAEGGWLTPAEFPQLAARFGRRPIEVPPLPKAEARPERPADRTGLRDPYALSLLDEEGEMRRLDDLEAAIIRFALAHYRGRVSTVSHRLGIGRSTLYRKLRDLGLEGAARPAGGEPAAESRLAGSHEAAPENGRGEAAA
jgi:DNA-binding NtrC family response regulator